MRHLRATLSLGLWLGLLLALASPLASQAAGGSDDPPTMTDPMALQPASQLPLEGTTWRLRDYRYRGSSRTSGTEVAAWMTLRAGTLRASGGCTRFSGRYGSMGSAIRIELGKLKRNDCAEQTTIVQLGMVDGLRRASSYEMVPSDEPLATQLVLRNPQGMELLRFDVDDIGALEPGEWRLLAFTVDGERIDALPGQPAVLSFQRTRSSQRQRSSSGQAIGSTGCNGFLGRYFRHASALSFGRFERTEAPCPAALQTQERALLAVLDSTALTLELLPDRLVLTSADTGERLDFVTSSPLEGTTWLLSDSPGPPASRDTVTLRLDGGVASGEGPCGPYDAAYVSDGLFITFADVLGAEQEACDQAAQEKRLLTALRAAVLLDRAGPQLRLLDARGRVVARFEAPGGP